MRDRLNRAYSPADPIRWVIRAIAAFFFLAFGILSVPFILGGRGGELLPHVPFLVGVAVGIAFTERAFAHLSDNGLKHPLGVLMRGSFARREDFTDQGWRYRRWSLTALWIGFLVSAFMIVLL